MDNAEVLTIILGRNQDAIMRAVDGLSHADSLLQLEAEANCMNWVLGHIAVFRDGMLAEIGLQEYMSESEVLMYDDGSSPITGENDAAGDLEQLVRVQIESYDVISEWLREKPEGLDKVAQADSANSKGYMGYWPDVATHFAQNMGHEAIHVGELNALRELALLGK